VAGETALPSAQTGEQQSRLEAWLEILTSLLMAFAVVLTAYSAYEATRWGGVQADNFAQASSLRTQATALTAIGTAQIGYDANTFAEIVIAFRDRDLSDPAVYDEAKAFAEDLMRAESLPALEEWLNLDPLTNPGAPRTPLEMPSYRNANIDEANRLTTRAEEHFNAARDANQTGDDYVLATIFFAAVLFFTGLKVYVSWVRHVVLSFAAICLIAGLVRILTLPFE
jgi:hypothetical protein